MDIFYNLSEVMLQEKKDLIKKSVELSYKQQIDELDCSKSWARTRSTLSIDEIMLKLENTSHIVFIERINNPSDSYFEIGFSTFNLKIDYFLFLFLSKENGLSIVNAFNLKKQ